VLANEKTVIGRLWAYSGMTGRSPAPIRSCLLEPEAGRDNPTASAKLTATHLTELDLPLDWAEQYRLLAS
jgi:hypothetical protein